MSTQDRQGHQHVCCVPGCNSVTTRDPYSFFRVMKSDQTISDKWIEAINRKISDENQWQPSKNSRICGKHFIGGAPSKNSGDPNSVPTLYMPEPDQEETDTRKRPSSEPSSGNPVRFLA